MAAQGLDNLVHHRQSDAGSPHRVAGLEEFLLYLVQVIRRDAPALVPDGRRHGIRRAGQGQEDGAAGLRVFDGVVKHVDKDLPQPGRIRPHRVGLGRFLVDKVQPLLADAGFHKQGGVGGFGHKIQHLAVELDAVLQAGKIQQFLHHGVQAVGLGTDDGKSPPVVFVVGIVDGLDGFHPTFDGGQGGAQFMTDRRDELVFQPVGLGQVLRHLVDGVAQPADLIVVFGGGQPGFQVSPAMRVAVASTSPSGRTMERTKNSPLHSMSRKASTPMPTDTAM